MYNEYFGFKEAPFSIAPDPRYLYMTSQHRDALAHLVYGLNSEGGCILLTGEVGTGKTTICRCLLEQIPEQANVALVLNPKVNEIELLETICDELHISYPDSSSSVKTYTDRIYDFLIESNQKNEKTVLIIDEAQNLDSKVLEQLRLLTNLETNQRKLLQIIILGQPELLDILAQTEMRQLAQRITARFHLKPLNREEVKAYISHRLAVAGQNIQLFPENSIKLVYKLSRGIPRLINVICDRALLGAYVENQYAVNPSIVKKAAKEVFGELKNVEQHKPGKKHKFVSEAVIGLMIFALSALLAYLYYTKNNSEQELTSVTAGLNSQQSSTELVPRDMAETEIAATDAPVETVFTEEIADNTETQPVNEQLPADPATELNNNYVDFSEIINEAPYSPSSAYQVLFDSWDLQYNDKISVTACRQAESQALNCLFKHGNLNSLKLHNRPAVLTLKDSQGKKRYIAITSINEDLATIYSNNTAYTVKLNELDQYWYGQFVMLWKKPEHYVSAILPGKSGSMINWLNTQLSKINGINPARVTHIYDDYLVMQVKAFQSRQGLTADGIVGPLTILYINTNSGINAPVLDQPASAATTQQQ